MVAKNYQLTCSVTQHVESNDDEIKKDDSDSHVEQGKRKDQNVDELEITESRPDIALDKNETKYEDLHNPFDLETGQLEQMQVKDLSIAQQWKKQKTMIRRNILVKKVFCIETGSLQLTLIKRSNKL